MTLSSDEKSWIASLSNIGQLFGAVATGILAGKFGRNSAETKLRVKSDLYLRPETDSDAPLCSSAGWLGSLRPLAGKHLDALPGADPAGSGSHVLRHSGPQWSTLIGPDPSRYGPLIG